MVQRRSLSPVRSVFNRELSTGFFQGRKHAAHVVLYRKDPKYEVLPLSEAVKPRHKTRENIKKRKTVKTGSNHKHTNTGVKKKKKKKFIVHMKNKQYK